MPSFPPKSVEELRAALLQTQEFYKISEVRIPESMPEVNGIFLGGCVERGVGSSFRARAHAHNGKETGPVRNPFAGWICIRSIKRLGSYVVLPIDPETGKAPILIAKPSQLLMHEYAHILTPGHSHDDAWRAKMRELGQPLPSRYKKKVRAK